MITREEIENIAVLSKLFVDEKDIDKLNDDMQKIIDFANTISEVDDSCFEYDNDEIENAFRADVVKESFDKEDILKNASDTAKDHFFVRKKV